MKTTTVPVLVLMLPSAIYESDPYSGKAACTWCWRIQQHAYNRKLPFVPRERASHRVRCTNGDELLLCGHHFHDAKTSSRSTS